MEFKRKVVKTRKSRQTKRNKKRGLKRVVCRGRKRWVKPESETRKESGA